MFSEEATHTNFIVFGLTGDRKDIIIISSRGKVLVMIHGVKATITHSLMNVTLLVPKRTKMFFLKYVGFERYLMKVIP
jgi:hypothetical protein